MDSIEFANSLKEGSKMISNAKYGWCNFKLGNFEGHPSYLTDVPVEILDAFIDYHIKKRGMVWFDEEGTEFTLVINPYSIYIIEEKEEPVLHDFPDISVVNLSKELIEDIEKDLNGWSEFITDEDWDEITKHRNEIRQRLMKLKELIKYQSIKF